MRSLLKIYALVNFVTGCTVSPYVPLMPEHKHIVFHADTEFTYAEREQINASVVDWFYFSGGNIACDIVYDLDFNSTTSVVKYGHDTIMARMLSWYDPVVDPHMLGVTTKEHQIYFVVDRIPNMRVVSRHEIGHAFGLHHVDNYNSVMSDTYNESYFTVHDLNECRSKKLCW